MSGEREVLVYSEQAEIALELLSAGRTMADEMAARLTAIVAGREAEAREHLAHGADGVLLVPEDGRHADADLLAAILHSALLLRRPELLLVGATVAGTEAAARVAQRLGAGCAGDCTELAFEDGQVVVRRRVLGRFLCRQVILTRPAIVTVPPRRFAVPERRDGRSGPVEPLELTPPPARIRVTAVRERETAGGRVDKADVVVAAGRGVRRPEDLALVEELARSLGGVVAATRPLTDDLHWLPSGRKVGLSGVTVAPRLYIACGVSGQIEHTVGMRESGVVVAINSDPGAPIMEQADYCVAADLYEVVPALTRAVRELV